MSKIEINWDADLHPNKHNLSGEDQPFALVPQIRTYGTYPITDAVEDTVVRIKS